jgi:hypothetical protein
MSFHQSKITTAIIYEFLLTGTSFHVTYRDLQIIWNGAANMLGAQTKRNLKNAELQAKKEQLRIGIGFQPPVTNITPIHNQKFTGKVSSFAMF